MGIFHVLSRAAAGFLRPLPCRGYLIDLEVIDVALEYQGYRGISRGYSYLGPLRARRALKKEPSKKRRRETLKASNRASLLKSLDSLRLFRAGGKTLSRAPRHVFIYFVALLFYGRVVLLLLLLLLLLLRRISIIIIIIEYHLYSLLSQEEQLPLCI